jgi:hypothetical protein
MKKSYDFSKGDKNPYYKKLKKQGFIITPDISFDLSELFPQLSKKSKHKKKSNLVQFLIELTQRVEKLEKELKKQ